MGAAPDLPVEDILESLDLTRAEPGIGLLRALFARFNARVPFETASKIERDASVSSPDEKPRDPETFWRDHLELGAGGTCFARVAAFDALISRLGFVSRKVLGRVQNDFDHAALRVEAPGGPLLCDVGFPLPELLPWGLGETDTPLGEVRVSHTERGFGIELGGVPEGPRRLEIFDAPVSEEEYAAHWRRTFRADSKFLTFVSLRRQLENRAVSFASGVLRVDDRHSRLAIPLESARPERLAGVFEIDPDLLRRAFDRVGDPDPESRETTLTAYLPVEADPDEAFAAIGDASGYRRLMSGIGRILEEVPTPVGFRIRLAAPGAEAGDSEALLEEVAIAPATRSLRVERRAGGSSAVSFYRAESRPSGVYLIREAKVSRAPEDLLRNDALRGRLAGALAMDLLAWGRLLPAGRRDR
jgi:arylamine N-acetyltransferase